MNTKAKLNNWASTFVLALLFNGYACRSHNNSVVVVQQQNVDGGVTFRIDSVRYPEMRTFPVFISIVNKSRNRLIILLDSIKCPSGKGVNQIILTTGSKKYLMAVKDRYLLCDPLTTRRLVCQANYQGPCGFLSFREIDSAFSNGKLIYAGEGNLLDPSELNLKYQGDTLIVPYQIEGRPDKPLIYY